MLNFKIMKKPERRFFDRDTLTVAKELLGHYLVHKKEGSTRIGKIVEVEAYIGQEDLASHSSKGLTKRTAPMFGPAGHAYIYLIYGMYYCFNVVTEAKDIGAAVLIRALEPIANIEARTQGPGLLTKAMDIDLSLNGIDLLGDTLFISSELDARPYETPESIIAAPRIGIGYAKEWIDKPFRFYIKDNPFVSRIGGGVKQSQ